MRQLTLRNLIANKARMALITLAVVIGVSFVSSTFIFSDSLSKTFSQLATDIAAGTDLEVRQIDDFGSSDVVTVMLTGGSRITATLLRMPGTPASTIGMVRRGSSGARTSTASRQVMIRAIQWH